nr:utrophin-like [Danio rerio]|eukprot:XP_009296561.1 utrophin-like [Danio rerio]
MMIGLNLSLQELLEKFEEDIQAEIEAHNDVFRSVEGNKLKMVKALGGSEEAVFLQQRLDDMNQRWSDLKAKSANIRAHLEASAERWNRLLSVLEDLSRWIGLKDEELNKQMPIGGDVPTLLQQQTHGMALRAELKEREHVVLSTLDQARMFLAEQPIEGPEEPRKNLQPKTGEHLCLSLHCDIFLMMHTYSHLYQACISSAKRVPIVLLWWAGFTTESFSRRHSRWRKITVKLCGLFTYLMRSTFTTQMLYTHKYLSTLWCIIYYYGEMSRLCI